MKQRYLLAVGAIALGLSACGGGGGGSDVPEATAQVPASASESTTGFMSYIQALVVSKDETLDPVDASSTAPPKDETSDPIVWS
ncbi:MAG: hypothetical protein ABIO45_14235 [Burkholderiaceae bacterium]